MKDTYPQQNMQTEPEAYTLRVYNTCTDEYEEVSVTKEVYEAYRRIEWNIKDNDKRFYKHEIQFSGLIGSEDENHENFHEFIKDETPETIIIQSEIKKMLHECLRKLNAEDKAMMNALFFERVSEREYSLRTDTPQKTINCRKLAILGKMRKMKIFKK